MSTTSPSESTPFLQIFQFSDIHYVQGGRCLWPDWTQSPWSKFLAHADYQGDSWHKRKYRQIYEFVQEGVAPYEPMALSRLYRYLRDGGHREEEWSEVETWLVHTGDLSGYADGESIDRAIKFLRAAKPFGERFATIHGNHDLWPEKNPYFGEQSLIDAKVAEVPPLFAAESDPFPWSTDIPVGGARLELHALDTVDPNYVDNAIAVGRVRDSGLKRLEQIPGSVDRFRVLLVHHPLSHPSGRWSRRSIFDPAEVAGALVDGGRPRFHLVLGGHTHALHPALGGLAETPSAASHPPLTRGQAQMVIGTATQYDEFAGRDPFPHQAQLLRFRASADGEGRPVVSVERVLVARRHGMGDFHHIAESDVTRHPIQAMSYTVS